MGRFHFCLITVILTSHIRATQLSTEIRTETDVATKQPVIINNVNSSVPAHIHVTINNTTNANTWISAKAQELASALQNTNQKLLDLKEYCFAYCTENKGFLVCCVTVAVYSILCGRLLYLEHVLNNSNQWSGWKNEFTLEQLLSLLQKDLAKELLFAIQQRYHAPTTLHDFFLPLVSFFNDLEHELKLLKQFDTLHNRIDKLCLSWFFPGQQELRKEVSTRINKALYFKQLLITWIAEYKIAIAAPITCPPA